MDTREIAPDVRLDLDEHGRPVGLDIDHASEILDLDTLETAGLPLEPTRSPARRQTVGDLTASPEYVAPALTDAALPTLADRPRA